jgi:hypothetical protein
MIRSMINKLIAATRVTVLAGGLAVIMTLTTLGTTTALAALPGDPLRLGQLNALDGATTILSGTQANGAMLEIGNSSSDFDDPALTLRVQAGRPPLVVSSGAGRATNLDADKLDGKDSSDFASGINGKALDANTLDGLDSTAFNGIANNADKLDGKDSAEFAAGANGIANNANLLDGKDSTAFANGTNGIANNANLLDGKDSTAFWSGKNYVLVVNLNGPGNGGQVQVGASCDAGDSVLSIAGGSSAKEDWVSGSAIDTTGENGFLLVTDNSPASGLTATVACADFPPLRP